MPFPIAMRGRKICCAVADADVVEYVPAYAKVCLLYHVTGRAASTYNRSITYGANYKTQVTS